jgi:hypothetical protein
MKRTHVQSETFSSLGYREDAHLLEAEFRDGDVYWYFDVPARVWRRFMNAPSKGRFFASEIRDRYRYEKVH